MDGSHRRTSGALMKIGDMIEYTGPLQYKRPKYGIIIHLKKIQGGHEVGVYFPNNSYVMMHSKFVGVVCR